MLWLAQLSMIPKCVYRMKQPSPQKMAEWRARAAKKDAIVPHYFEVFATKVIMQCGKCRQEFRRPLIPNLNEPTFVCPNASCKARNWIPLRYEKG